MAGRRTSTVVIAGALLAGSATGGSLSVGAAFGAATVPGPQLEYEWEVGTAGTVHDGDTLTVGITRSRSGYTGNQRVRTTGVNAPEVAHTGQREQCGAAQAKATLKKLLPKGTPVQLRALAGTSWDKHSGGRIVRSIYAQDDEGNWFDTSRSMMSSGTMLWFPKNDSKTTKPEWAHNLEYRVLADDAAAAKRGLWAPNLCGKSPAPNAKLKMWVGYDTGGGRERAWIANYGTTPVSIAGWVLRDSALNKYKFPKGATIPAGGSVRLQMSTGRNDPSKGLYFTGKNEGWFTNLPATNHSFVGDAAYLMDSAGKYETGNLRTWFAYPCNPDTCNDAGVNPLRGKVRIDEIRADDPAKHDPSRPQAVTAAVAPDGSVVVSWKAPADLGGPKDEIQYEVTARAAESDTTEHPDTGSATTRTFTGLTAGVAHTFIVRAVNPQGAAASAATPAVVPNRPASPPQSVTAAPVGTGLTVAWRPPADDGFAPITSYTVTATPGAGTPGAGTPGGAPPSGTPGAPGVPAAPASVTTTGPVTSATLPGLAPMTEYSVVVRANTTMPGVPAAPVSATTGPAAAVTIPGAPVPGAPAPGNAAPVAATSSPEHPRGPTKPTPDHPVDEPWQANEEIVLVNTTGSAVRLDGYALFDKDARDGEYDSPDAIIPPGVTIPAGGRLRVLTGSGTDVAGKRVFTGAKNFLDEAADRVELAGLNKALATCQGYGGVSCAGQAPITNPTQPVGVTARTTANAITVTWGGPVSRGGAPITGYTATAFDSATAGRVTGACSTDGAGRSCSIPGAMGKRYFVEVVARNRAGVSAPSAPRIAGVPKTVPSAVKGIRVAAAPGGADVTWQPATGNGAAVTAYVASAYVAGTGGTPAGACRASGGATACSIRGLVPGTRYFIDVVAANRAGRGPASTPRPAVVAAPSSALSSVADRKITVRWDPPAPGMAVTGFDAAIFSKPLGGKRLGACSAAATATSCVTGKLKKAATYYIELTTRTGTGSFTLQPRIATGAVRKASAPRQVVAKRSPAGVAVSWAAPSSSGFTPLLEFQARLHTKAKGGKVGGSCAAPAPQVACAIANPAAKAKYASVRVRNAKGWSKWAKRVKIVGK